MLLAVGVGELATSSGVSVKVAVGSGVFVAVKVGVAFSCAFTGKVLPVKENRENKRAKSPKKKIFLFCLKNIAFTTLNAFA